MDILIDGRVLTEDKLRSILAHYDAIPILIQAAKKHAGFGTLAAWDEARKVKKP